MKDILLNIIQLQEKKYVHCDIKADNIMICGTDAKLIDWDLAIKHTDDNYAIKTICENRYHGSGTHQSPLIADYLYKKCSGKFGTRIGQKLVMSLSKTLGKRNIPSDHNKIHKITKEQFGRHLGSLIK